MHYIITTLLLVLVHTCCLSQEHFLSFIMPCYNCASTVVESLDSIHAQKNLKVPCEIICCNDGSTDSTAIILENYAQTHPLVRVIHHKNNRGGAEARNTCVRDSQGDLIFCLDSDNILEPNTVQSLVELLDESGCDGAAFGEIWFFHDAPNGKKIRANTWIYDTPNNRCTLADMVRTFYVPASSGNYLYTRKSFEHAGGYLTTADAGGAFDAWTFGFRQAAMGSIIAILPKTHYLHRVWANGKSYYSQEERKGNNGRNGYAVLKEFMYLYHPATQKFLASNPLPQTFYDSVNKGLIRIAH